MSKARLLDFSASQSEIFHFDEMEKKVVIEKKQNVEPIIRLAKDMSELEPSKGLRHVGIIPNVILDDAYRKGKFKTKESKQKFMKDFLNNPDNKYFRTWPGRI